MPQHEFVAAVGHALRPRQHRLAFQITMQIQRHRFHRRIALLRTFRQRLEHDVIEVAGHFFRAATQCLRARRVAVGFAQQGRRRFLRIRDQNRFFPLGVGLPFQFIRLGFGQQLVQHHAQRIHVGHRGHGFAADLFRRGVVQGERAHFGAGVVAAGFRAIEQFGDTEIQQPHFVQRRDHDVRGLEIAMHDQIRVRVTDRFAHLQNKLQPRFGA